MRHTQDSHCDVDEETDICHGCGVHHGDPCPDCGFRGFHHPACATVNEESAGLLKSLADIEASLNERGHSMDEKG